MTSHAKLLAVAALLALAPACGGAGPAASKDAAPEARDARDAGDAGEVSALDARADADGGAEGGSDAADASADRPEGGEAGDAASQTDADAGTDVLSPLCAKVTRALRLPTDPVAGVLQGPSDNPAVGCRGGLATYGPDATFSLTLDQTTVVELEVDAQVDTVIALRQGCAGGISELACGEQPVDASPRRKVRARLAAGTYTIVVDAIEASTQPAPFTLAARAVVPLDNATCAAPIFVASVPATFTNQEPDLGGDPKGACGGAGAGAALFYSVGVPAGSRLAARANSVGSAQPWLPRMWALSDCVGGTCLAQSRVSTGTTQQLDWSNNGSTWRLVVLGVASDGFMSGATFDLSVDVVSQLAECARPTAVSDGTTLLNQNLFASLTSARETCNGANDFALYYTATLLPRQQLTADAVGTVATPGGGGNVSPAVLSVRETCETAFCDPPTLSASYTNRSDAPKTVIIEATPRQGSTSGTFDLHVSIPPPPASISVRPTAGLVTSEAGATATFQVVLGSPPTADVTVSVASDTPGEGTASPASLKFDATSWKVPQTVTVTGVDDHAADGPRPYKIVTSAASIDPRYTGFDVDDVEVTNLDDDSGVTLEGAEDLATSEEGGQATFVARLNRQPTATVRVPLSSSDVAEGTVSPAELVFTTSDWNAPHAVTVTGVDDALVDGVQAYAVVLGAMQSADPAYAGQDLSDLPVHNRDDDLSSVTTKLLSGDRVCAFLAGQSITTDADGNLYVAMSCESQLLVVTSADGGRTFSAPIVVAPSGDIVELVVAGGPGGVAYLAYESGSDGLVFTRTTDGGATWAAGQTLAEASGRLRLVAARQTVMVLAAVPGDEHNAMLWRSFDEGRSFRARSFTDALNLNLFLRPDGRTTYLLEEDAENGGQRLRKSADGGETFTRLGGFNINEGFTGVTDGDLLFASGSELRDIPFSDFDDSHGFNGLIQGAQGLVIDDAGVATILDADIDTGRLAAARVQLPIDGTHTPSRTLIGPHADADAAAVLSRHAVAVSLLSGSVVLFTVVTFP